MSSDKILDVAARLQDASWCENGVIEVIKTLGAHLGASGGVLLNFRGGEIVSIGSHGIPPIEEKYAQEINLDPELPQPHLEYSLNSSVPHTIADYDFMDERELDRHPFYDWLYRACGVRYFIGSRLHGAGNNFSLLGMHFTREQGHATEEQIKHCTLLRPHLANAFRIADLRRQTTSAQNFADLVGGALPDGIVGLDQRGRCIVTNEAADAIFAANDGIDVDSEGEIKLTDRSAESELARHISSALEANSRRNLFSGGEVLVPRRSGRLPYFLRVAPGLKRSLGFDVGVPTVLITIVDSEIQLRVDRIGLQLLYGFTNREVELVTHLVAGVDLKGAADEMGITHNTARVHLQSVMRKTDTHSQAELVGRVCSLGRHTGSQ